jgi:formate dehydrogenase gamma subunit
MINANNLTHTCGQCHIGAGANFAKGKIHLNEPLALTTSASPDAGLVGTKVVRWIYLPMIVLVIGGMVFHNLLIWRKKTLAKRKHEHRDIPRLSRNQRLQHLLLLTSFLVLVVSGFALQYPNSAVLAWLLGSSETFRSLLHRIAGVVMLVVGVYHLVYLAVTTEGRSWVKDMTPRMKDVTDVVQNFSYYLGFSKVKPKIARFGYAEKAEYWAVIWGTIIMGLTGLMIWFKLGVFSILPRWWIDIAIAVHFYEAVLATLAIIVWHFYHVIFDPDVYPINWAFVDGKVSEELYREEHELDYERIKVEQAGEPLSDEGDGEPSPAVGT